jgi:hypothetical protein
VISPGNSAVQLADLHPRRAERIVIFLTVTTAEGSSLLEGAVAPLDRIRRASLALAFRMPPLARLLSRRQSRLALIATLHALVALVLAIVAPVVLIVLGPILLGVPHVAGDVRYLVLRRRLPAWWKNGIWVACGLLVALRLVEELHPDGLLAGAALARIEMGGVALWVIAAALLGAFVAGSWRRLPWLLPPLLAFGFAGVTHPELSRLVYAHVHNIVGIALWLALFRRQLTSLIVPLIVIAGGVALLMSGLTLPWTFGHHAILQAFHLHLLAASDWLAPGLPVGLAVGLTCTYAYLQSLHYGVWLIYVPQEDVASQGTLTFRMSLRSLWRDFGRFGVAAIVLALAVVVGFGFFHPLRARAMYLSLAMFHGYLELALLAYFAARAGGVVTPRAASAAAP